MKEIPGNLVSVLPLCRSFSAETSYDRRLYCVAFPWVNKISLVPSCGLVLLLSSRSVSCQSVQRESEEKFLVLCFRQFEEFPPVI